MESTRDASAGADAVTYTSEGTVLLSRSDVERLLTLDECFAAVENAFRERALGNAPAPGILGLHAPNGGFHIKAALLALDQPYFAAKVNANFPNNGSRYGLPTIQGVVALCDAANGMPLAVMDSMAITALRTAAATAVAAKYLARDKCDAALVCGCGAQARAQLRALLRVHRPSRVYAYDQNIETANAFARLLHAETGLDIAVADDLPRAIAASDVVITCTTAQRYFVAHEMVRPGTFIAAVGADNENKQELDPVLLARNKVVTDITEQCAAIGDLHHAVAAGLMSASDVHAELGEIIAGRKPGRTSDNEITIFDSTGTALQDVAVAAEVYRRAMVQREGTFFSFNA